MNLPRLLRLSALCLSLALGPRAASAWPGAPSTPTNEPALADAGARNPEFSRLVEDLKARATSLTKWWSLKSALKTIGYSKEEMARTKDALSKKTVSLKDASFFCARWQERHQEVIDPRQLLAVLKQLLEIEGPQLAGSE